MLSLRPVVGTIACTRSRTARRQVVLCQQYAQFQTESDQENMLRPNTTCNGPSLPDWRPETTSRPTWTARCTVRVVGRRGCVHTFAHCSSSDRALSTARTVRDGSRPGEHARAKHDLQRTITARLATEDDQPSHLDSTVRVGREGVHVFANFSSSGRALSTARNVPDGARPEKHHRDKHDLQRTGTARLVTGDDQPPHLYSTVRVGRRGGVHSFAHCSSSGRALSTARTVRRDGARPTEHAMAKHDLQRTITSRLATGDDQPSHLDSTLHGMGSRSAWMLHAFAHFSSSGRDLSTARTIPRGARPEEHARAKHDLQWTITSRLVTRDRPAVPPGQHGTGRSWRRARVFEPLVVRSCSVNRTHSSRRSATRRTC
jgi:hypothetical protein